MTYREAVRSALREILRTDARAFLMGEDVGAYGGSFACSKGLLEEFGPERVRDTPLAESTFLGAGIGAAMGGMRPIVEIMTVNFSLLALDQIVNNAATLRHMSGGQISVPLVVRMATGGGRQLAAQHSHSLEGWYAHVPGIRVAVPATPADARGMLLAAMREPDPVFLFEPAVLYPVEDEVDEAAGPADLRHALVRRAGRDLTLVAFGAALPKALAAADALAREDVSAEVVDVRVLRPLDLPTIAASVARTRRAIVVDEAWRTGGFAAEIAASLAEQVFYDLDAPIGRICGAEVPLPYPKHLEDAALPQAATIAAAARALMGRHG
ncbi:MAG TPA: pyruvate dehydrogenase complex E1 component subunit beta [Candidatus Eisenbacteria bacterium]|nr:pyruvate dehydrogenase complex E1 component subunit beta [Candidatus Eisenbacteria bacterium]